MASTKVKVMSEFLLELFSEEIPARFQQTAEQDLTRSFRKMLDGCKLPYDTIRSFSTPRRLGISITGLPLNTEPLVEERKGPAVNAPDQSIQGFLKSVGKDKSDTYEKEIIGKGLFLFVEIITPSRSVVMILSEIAKDAIREVSWPKSMRWKSNQFKWARPLHNILCIFNEKIVPLHIAELDLTANSHTFGHRFLSHHQFTVSHFQDYKTQLKNHYVEVDHETRKSLIEVQIQRKLPKGCQVLEDQSLLSETANLVEWPIVYLGTIDQRFMSLPREVLVTSMRVHQKYFAVTDAANHLKPYFLIVSNMETVDQGQQIIEGNERVLRARLSDAQFFWNQDTKHNLKFFNEKLKDRVFQKDLGSVYDKVQRTKMLGKTCINLFPEISPDDSAKAFDLLKADLSTDMVGEFPELQGIMGGYYAAHQGESKTVSDAITTHYAPQGPQDSCPETPLGQYVALMDKLDTLVGFFSVGIQPTASKDPYGLRRLALGILRLLQENGARATLEDLVSRALKLHKTNDANIKDTILTFFNDRLEGYLKDIYNLSHIRACLHVNWSGAVADLIDKLDALKRFLESPDGKDFLTVYARAANILSDTDPIKSVNPSLLGPEEKTLFEAVQKAEDMQKTTTDYKIILQSLANLKAPLEIFFQNVMVNDDNLVVRSNRMGLLQRVTALATKHFHMKNLLGA